jgi:hypothetical protein
VARVWNLFINVCVNEIRSSFEMELVRKRNEQTLNIIAPQQGIEENERRKKRAQLFEKRASTTDGSNKTTEEELYEDPF